MAAVRFIHADHLRLGSPIQGLSSSPAWLQELAAGAVRQAVHNLIESAVANRVDFLLMAGDITESGDDLNSAAAWLAEQVSVLQARGIAVAAFASSDQAFTALSEFCDFVLRSEQLLKADRCPEGRLQLELCHRGEPQNGLLVSCGHQSGSLGSVGRRSGISYRAIPLSRPDENRSVANHDGFVTRTAGAAQAIQPSESWECGAILVEADTETGAVHTHAVSTDVLRFATERLSLPQAVSPHELINEVVRASDAIQKRSTQTVIADWVIRCDVHAALADVKSLLEAKLLKATRERLQGGHRGVWPRSIRFAEESRLLLESSTATEIEEYFDVAHGPVSVNEVSGGSVPASAIQGQNGIPGSLITGLALLAEAA